MKPFGTLAAEIETVLSYHPETNWYIKHQSGYDGFWTCPWCKLHVNNQHSLTWHGHKKPSNLKYLAKLIDNGQTSLYTPLH